uniref:Condensin-2 complex subunit D3 n=1 Tax=Leptobrachium leishanense TaxID=445787 RepID=A0A8C5PFA2_9ANUR
MGDMEAELLEALGRCGLRELSKAWVESVWEFEFTEAEPLDARVEAQITENGLEVFSNLYESLLPFASGDHEKLQSVWMVFAQNEICRKSLLALLYHFIHAGEHKKADVMQRSLSLHAAGLYFLLLEIPGSVVSQMFHPVLFDKCVSALEKTWPQEPDTNRKRKKDTMKSSQAAAHGGRKRARPNRKEIAEPNDVSDEDEGVYFSSRDLMNIRESIFLLLKNFLRLLPTFSLKEKPQSTLHCMQVFINMTRFESVPQELPFSASLGRMKYVPELAYHGLWLLCLPIHGDVGETLRLLFHRLLSVLLMTKSGDMSYSAVLAISPPVTSAKNQAIRFISFLVEELKDVAFPVLRILLQHLCVKFPDKSDYRSSAVQVLVKLLEKFPNAEYASFIDWLYKYSRKPKVSHRAFALDAAVSLLELPSRQTDESFPPDMLKFLQRSFLLQDMVFSRCSDIAPTVRSKGLSCLAQCLDRHASSAVAGAREPLQGIRPQETSGPLQTVITDGCDFLKSDGRETLTMLQQRAGDEKTTVRKSALQVLVNIFKYDLIPFSPEDLNTLPDRCRDPAVSVRKQALSSLTELLQAQPQNVQIQKAWLTGLVPVVLDTESTVQEKGLEYLEQIMLRSIAHCNRYRPADQRQKLTWDLLTLLTTESQELSRYLTKACHLWAKQNKFSATLVTNLISHTEAEHAAPAWMLLSKVAGSSPKLDYTKVLNFWDQVSRQTDANITTTAHVLCVIGHIAKHLPADTRRLLIDHLKSWLLEFKSSPELIGPAVESLQKLCYAHFDAATGAQELLNDVCGHIVDACEEYLSSVLMTESRGRTLDQDMMVKHLFTLGHAAQQCPARVGKKVLLLVQSILANSLAADQNSDASQGEDISESQPLSQFRGSNMPSVVRAHAFITLGKLCLQHDDLAKKCVPALVRELEVCRDMAIRNNVIIVICDLCVRYTAMVDRYIPNVSVCLRDQEPFIRRQTLILLTNLLQEDFIKWKGSLFFRFVSVLVDPDLEIAKLGEFCLVHLLLKRNPIMFSQHFIECVFHFNSYQKHEKYNKFAQTEREKTCFSLKGPKNKEKRMKIYKFLLENFTDEQRFNLTSKLSENVLACFVDGVLPVDADADELLCDVFEIMSCKEIKLSTMRSKPGEDVGPDDDEMVMANAVIQVAQKKIISQVQKRNFIDNIVPIITSLKKLLEQRRMSTLRPLMSYLREMMQDYRDEIKDVFAADKQLAVELEYDIRKYEEQLQREKEQSQQAEADVTRLSEASRTPRGSPRVSDAASTRSPAGRDVQAGAGDAPCTPVTTPQVGVVQSQGSRRTSLSTINILNSAKKVMERRNKKQHSKSVGAQPSVRSPLSVGTSKPELLPLANGKWNRQRSGEAAGADPDPPTRPSCNLGFITQPSPTFNHRAAIYHHAAWTRTAFPLYICICILDSFVLALSLVFNHVGCFYQVHTAGQRLLWICVISVSGF